MKKKSKIIIFTYLFFQTLISFGQHDDGRFDSLLLNRSAPIFAGTTLGGVFFDLTGHKGKVVLVNFWSLNCAACFKEIPDFNRIVHERSAQDFVLISLMDNSKEEVDNKIEKSGRFYKLRRPAFKNDAIEFEIIPDAGDVLKNYGFQRGFPLTVYIDKEGVVRNYVHGYIMSYEGTGMSTNYDVHNGILNKLLGQR